MNFRLPHFLRHDLLRKLVALFFALVIWLTVSAQLSETMVLHNVPINLLYDPAETIVESEVPTVGVTVRGSPRALEQLKSSDIRLSAQVANPLPGSYFADVIISRHNVDHTPPGIRVVDIDRNKIQVRLDRIVTRTDIPINVRFEGKIREGYRRTRRAVVPATTTIRGPYRVAKDIQEVTTEPVVLDDTIVRDFEQDIPLTPIPGVEMGKMVHVSVQVARTSGQTNYADLPMVVLIAAHSPLQVKGELPLVSVTVRGPQAALDKLTPAQIHAFIDLTGITTAGQQAGTVQVWIDGDAELTASYVHPAVVPLELVAAAASPDQKEPAPPAPAPNAPN